MLTALMASLCFINKLSSQNSIASIDSYFYKPLVYNSIINVPKPFSLNYLLNSFSVKRKTKKYKLKFIVTTYALKEPGVTGFTRLGLKLHKGIIAVDPRLIPMGSRIYVPGFGIGVAGDTGGRIRGHHLDFCVSSRKFSREWGLRRLEVVIFPSDKPLWKSRYRP